MRRIQMEKERKELEECSFAPKLMTKKKGTKQMGPAAGRNSRGQFNHQR